VRQAAIRAEGSGRVIGVPGLQSPIVTYRLTEGDMSRLARGVVHSGEVLLAWGATELYPSVADGPVVRRHEDLGAWWDASLMTVHLTSSVRMGEYRARTCADSFGRVWGYENLRINDASFVPDAPGVNPHGTIMAIAARNSDRFLSST
jgi:choline dehydrogenase-like flavoprotein